jgi:hypothetical protein
MRQVVALVAVCSCWTALGCAPGSIHPNKLASLEVWRNDPATTSVRLVDDSNGSRPTASGLTLKLDIAEDVAEESSEETDSPLEEVADALSTTSNEPSTLATAAYAEVAEVAEEVVTPQPAALEAVTTADDISDPDALTRRVTEVSVDIRPPQGELPPDLAAAAFAASAAADDEPANASRQETVVAWTPWTLCYRPLYFEEVGLERYGREVGCIQPGVSAVHFFFGVGLLPYKIVSRFPTSCQCSNGFSRCGDVPPPGYIDNRVHLDAAAIEAALLAGIVLALP